MCAIWDVPGKKTDENDIDATFLANLFRSMFYQKLERMKWLQLARCVSNTMSNKFYIFKSISTLA